jgi:hypothetical protein
MLIVGALFSRRLVTLTLSLLCEERNEERNEPEFGRSGSRTAVLVAYLHACRYLR